MITHLKPDQVKKTYFAVLLQGGCHTPESVQLECDPQEEVL